MRTTQAQIAWPRPGKLLIALIGANVALYVLELILLRANVSFVEALFLRPSDVFDGLVWQPFTYMWLHAPDRPTHLIFNMLWLWLFGTQLERFWGRRRFVFAYLLFGLSGAALTLIVALLSTTDALAPLIGGFWRSVHLGASGAVMGIVVGWGLVHAKQEMQFLLLGRMKGMTFVWIIVGFELLVALSFDPTSSSSHFGGMIAAALLCRGIWRPSYWGNVLKRRRLLAKKKALEHQLEILEGGKGDSGGSSKNGKGNGSWN